MAMVVVLDTCIINVDFHFSSISFQLLFDNHHLTDHTVAVPEVVAQETVNRFREKLAEDVGKMAASMREIGRFTGKKLDRPKIPCRGIE